MMRGRADWAASSWVLPENSAVAGARDPAAMTTINARKPREVAVLGHIPGPICHVTVAHSKAAVNDLVVAGACLRTLV